VIIFDRWVDKNKPGETGEVKQTEGETEKPKTCGEQETQFLNVAFVLTHSKKG
jgi:hypothetical protein